VLRRADRAVSSPVRRVRPDSFNRERRGASIRRVPCLAAGLRDREVQVERQGHGQGLANGLDSAHLALADLDHRGRADLADPLELHRLRAKPRAPRGRAQPEAAEVASNTPRPRKAR